MRTRPLLILAALLPIAAMAHAAEGERDPLSPLPVATGGGASLARGPSVLGTATLNAGITIYNARFRRVSETSAEEAQALAELARPLAGLSPDRQLAEAKRIVEARVKMTSDLDSMGVGDYWNSAFDTLALGKGDGEDIAIVEMKLLEAAGFPARDLWVSVGRHKVIGAHSTLFARTATGYYMLDATEPMVIDADTAGNGRFVPMVSIGTDGNWVHGIRRLASR